MRRKLLTVAGLLVAAWAAYGAAVRLGRAPRAVAHPGSIRGAWHVHTTRSDGRGSIDEVARAARDAGLQFVVVADHNVLTPGDGGYRDGVLVVQATEVSTPFGHVVALGVSRALTDEERRGDPLAAIRALGGEAVLAHPFHPRRPFTGWARGPWRGLEVVSNDTSWYRVLADRAAGKVAAAALAFPFDRSRAVLALGDDPSDELARFDAELAAARAEAAGNAPGAIAPSGPPGPGAGRPPGAALAPPRVLLCSADAHGYPSYGAAFEAFSMHVPVAPTGDGAADARAVSAALLDGRASCVFDGVWPVSAVRLDAGAGLALEVETEVVRRAAGAARPGPARVTVVRDGVVIGRSSADVAPGGRDGGAGGRLVLDRLCGEAPCAPGAYRAELYLGDRPWIFTNPVVIE